MVGLAAGRFRVDSARGFRARNVPRLRAAASPSFQSLCFARQCRSGVARSADIRSAFAQPRNRTPDRTLFHAWDSGRYIRAAPGGLQSTGISFAEPAAIKRRAEAFGRLAQSLPRWSAVLLFFLGGPEFARSVGPAQSRTSGILPSRGRVDRGSPPANASR